MENAGLYLWLWILIANAVAIVLMSNIGGAQTRNDRITSQNERRPL